MQIRFTAEFWRLAICEVNDNFWQAVSLFMFQGEWIINLNNLFSKPGTPVLTLGKPTAKHPGKCPLARRPVWYSTSWYYLHRPSSASVWSVWFDYSTMLTWFVWILMLDSIFRRLNWNNKGVKIYGESLSNLRFADDIFLCTETPQ